MTAEFAELDATNRVLRLVVIDEAKLLDENGEVVEALGELYLTGLLGGTRWVQTFRDGSKRKQQAECGGNYNETADVFVALQPFASWSLNDDFDWVPPVPYPDDGRYYEWDESALDWLEVSN